MATRLAIRDGGKSSEEGLQRLQSRLFTREGVLKTSDLVVQAAGTPDNTVRVQVGDCVIGENSPNATEPDFYYHGWITAEESITITANSSGNDRIDTVVAYVDLTVIDDTNNDNPNALVFDTVEGTPSATPAEPTESDIETAIGASNPYIVLAQVAVADGFSSITNTDITDARPHADTPRHRFSNGFEDYVESGGIVSQDTGLVGDITAINAYISGVFVYKPALSKTFTASKDTYIDLPDDAVPTNTDDYVYTEKTNGASAPALAADHIRIAKVVTDGTNITSVVQTGEDSLTNKIYPTTPIDTGDWKSTGGTHSVATGYNNGNRSFTIDTSTDLTSVVSPGMRYRVTRGTTAPTQCFDAEASSSHYANKTSPTGITFTDDFTMEAWIRPESYVNGYICARRASASGDGFGIFMQSDGTIQIFGKTTTTESATTEQSVPLGKRTHVAASLDISGAVSKMYINGVSVPFTQTATISALTQGGDLVIGANVDGSSPFDGEIFDVRIWSDIRTEAEIQDNMFAYPSDTTNLVGHFKLDGDFTDSSTNSNDLTAQNGAVATATNTFWNDTEYGIITAVTASDITVQCPDGYGIPNETLSAPFYSTQDCPFGFPRGEDKWVIEYIHNAQAFHENQSSHTNGTIYQFTGYELLCPIGTFELSYKAYHQHDRASGGSAASGATALSTSTTSYSDIELKSEGVQAGGGITQFQVNFTATGNKIKEHASATKYYILQETAQSGSGLGFSESLAPTVIKAKLAYL